MFALTFITYVLQVFENRRLDWNTIILIGVATFFGIPCKFSPKCISLRSSHLTILLVSTFQGALFTTIFMTWISEIHYFPRFDSFEQIIAAEYNLSGDSFALATLSNILDRRILNEKFNLCKSTVACLSQLYSGNDVAIALSNEYFRSISNEFKEHVYCISDHENGFSSRHGLHFLLRKTFEFKTELNRFIQMANQGGLISKWMSELSLKQLKQNEYISDADYTMELMIMELCTSALLILLAIIVFLMEIAVYKLKDRPRLRKFCAVVELAISPKRYFLNYDLRYMLPISYDKK